MIYAGAFLIVYFVLLLQLLAFCLYLLCQDALAKIQPPLQEADVFSNTLQHNL